MRAPSSSWALKRNPFSVRIGTITHSIAISGQQVPVLAALIYFALRAFALPTTFYVSLTLGLI